MKFVVRPGIQLLAQLSHPKSQNQSGSFSVWFEGMKIQAFPIVKLWLLFFLLVMSASCSDVSLADFQKFWVDSTLWAEDSSIAELKWVWCAGPELSVFLSRSWRVFATCLMHANLRACSCGCASILENLRQCVQVPHSRAKGLSRTSGRVRAARRLSPSFATS